MATCAWAKEMSKTFSNGYSIYELSHSKRPGEESLPRRLQWGETPCFSLFFIGFGGGLA